MNKNLDPNRFPNRVLGDPPPSAPPPLGTTEHETQPARDLEDLVEVLELHGGVHQQPPPDGVRCPRQRHPQLVDFLRDGERAGQGPNGGG